MLDPSLSHLTWLRIPLVADQMIAATPMWLWSRDGDFLLANAGGARILCHDTIAACVDSRLSPADPHRRAVIQLVRRSGPSNTMRLDRLPGFGGRLGNLTTCAWRIVALPAGGEGVLILASQPDGLSNQQRLASLVDGFAAPMIVMSHDGVFVRHNRAADEWSGMRDLLADPALSFVTGEAADNGFAAGDLPAGHVEVFTISGDGERRLLVAVVPSPACGAGEKSAPHRQERAEPSQNAELVAATADPEQPQDRLVPGHQPPADEPVMMVMDPIEAPPPPRKLPLRFMWSSDADGRFILQSEDFAELLGPRTAAVLDKPWVDIASTLGIDTDGTISQALTAPRTFNGVQIDWPTDDPATPLRAELSGVPFYDSARAFAGYRGFGLVRDLEALSKRDAAIAVAPRPAPLSAAATPADQIVDLIDEGPRDETVTEHVDTFAPPDIEPSANVVPFRAPQADTKPTLSPVENSAFNELARQLSARLEDSGKTAGDIPLAEEAAADVAASDTAASTTPAWLAPQALMPSGHSHSDVSLIDRIPTGVLIYRLDRLLYANSAFLVQVGYPDLSALTEAGGLDALYVEPGISDASSTSDTGTPVRVSSERSSNPPAEAALHTITWDGDPAMALIFATPRPQAEPASAPAAAEPPVAESIVAPEPKPAPLADIAAEPEPRTQRRADRAADVKADVLARISHEVRTPLNAIIGFADVMIAERFGALGNERYAEYLKDIRASGEHVIAIINDMLDLSHIETGKIDLTFASQNLNDLVEQCVGVMQPQANRERIIIRTALARSLPWISADARALRQIAMNLIGNSIHLANAGGQVIVSTALSDIGDVMLRVRDTGQGLNDNEMATALAPFRAPMSPADVTTANSGVNLSLTKALVEANRAQFQIKSSPQSGTLVEVRFPSTAARAG